MNARSLAAAAGAGVAAIGNRLLARGGGELPPGIDGDGSTFRWRGMDVEYTTLGDPEAPPLVLLHDVGIVGTSHEFAAIAPSLAENYRVYAPDLPGYGRSDRPPLTYSASIYEAFVEEFLDEVAADADGIMDPSVVASGLTGAYAALAAGADDDVDRLVLVTPTAATRSRSMPRRTLLRAPLLGTAAYNAMTSRAALASGGVGAGFDGEVPEDYLSYCWSTAHQPGARYAPASYLGGHLDPATDLESALTGLEGATLVWGREATDPPLAEGRALAEGTDSRLVVVDAARTLPHVEHPEETVAAIEVGLGDR